MKPKARLLTVRPLTKKIKKREEEKRRRKRKLEVTRLPVTAEAAVGGETFAL